MIPPLQRPAKASLGSVPGGVCQPGSGGWEPGGAGVRAVWACSCDRTAHSAPLPGRGGN